MTWGKDEPRGYHHGNLREALIRAALELIAQKGPAGFTFAEAARFAGVSPAAPYRHFRDRDELIASVALRGFREFEAALKRAWDGGKGGALAGLDRLGKAYLAFVRAEPAYYAAMFEAGVPVGAAPELREASDGAFAVLRAAAEALCRGQIVALKGLGGFQLLADARNEPALRRLRAAKRRPAKPFAVMVENLGAARVLAEISAAEALLLASEAAPIVLLRAKPEARLMAPSVAPGNPWLGILLPATPLHQLLAWHLGFPVVATSGNRGGEPIITEAAEAVQKLGAAAAVFLTHDRPILRRVDDSVARVLADGQTTVLRLARGYAPLGLGTACARPCIALGGHQKNALAAAVAGKIILGPHIGDLGSVETRSDFAQTAEAFAGLFNIRPQSAACDRHPDYYSTRFAEQWGPEPVRVPHHLAHVLAGMADNGLEGPVLGVAWDGSGDGGDGTIWGGEFLGVDAPAWRRVAHFALFRLPGNEAAIREPRRAALGALHAVFGDAALAMTDLPPVAAFTPSELGVLGTALGRGLNAPACSSAGRLFDAAAAVLGLCQTTQFEGEAALALEAAASRAKAPFRLPDPAIVAGPNGLILDWRRMFAGLVAARSEGIAAEPLAAGFHDALAAAIVEIARRAGIARVLLTGGCFQNAYLTGAAVEGLREAGFAPYWHHRVPPNDGGLAVGQAVFAQRPLVEQTG